jgi:hypothetical protein
MRKLKSGINYFGGDWMKKKATAALLLFGMLCVFALTLVPETAKPDPTGSAEPIETTENEPAVLSDYIEKGDSIVTALEADPSISQLIPFSVNGYYALANQDAIPVTDAIYDRVEMLSTESEILWVLYTDDQFTCVSETGDLIIPPTEGTVKLLDEQYLSCTASNGTTDIYLTNGKLVMQLDGKPHSCQDGILVAKNNDDTWSLTDTSSWQSVTVSNIRRIGSFSNGFAIVKISAHNWGVIDTAGEITRIPNVTRLWNVCDGYILAKNNQNSYGVISIDGTVVLPFEYRRANICSDELPIYQLWTYDGNCVVRNVKSKQSIRLPDEFNGEKLTAWSNHYYSFLTKDETLILFDDLGKLEFSSSSILYQQNENLMVACENSEFSIIRLEQGTQTKSINGRYLPSDGISDPAQSYLIAEDSQTGLQGVYDSSGKLMLDMEYDWIRPVSDNLFAVEQDNLCGLIDSRGRWKLCIEK